MTIESKDNNEVEILFAVSRVKGMFYTLRLPATEKPTLILLMVMTGPPDGCLQWLVFKLTVYQNATGGNIKGKDMQHHDK